MSYLVRLAMVPGVAGNRILVLRPMIATSLRRVWAG
jgi:hypothetical protein